MAERNSATPMLRMIWMRRRIGSQRTYSVSGTR
jgi:hypothetical protein